MKTGIELIAIERQEQIEKHGRDTEWDVNENTKEQLSFAAALLSCPNPKNMGFDPNSDFGRPELWDKKLFNKMMDKSYRQRLIIAGALIAAEIDRLNMLDARPVRNY